MALASVSRSSLLRLSPARYGAASSATHIWCQQFHATARASVKVGDSIPSIELTENSPGDKVNLAKELKGKGVIVGVPGAFSPACSQSHVPGFLKSPKLKDAGSLFVVSVNDAFVMKAWSSAILSSAQSSAKNVRFLADADGSFAKALDLDFDATAIFGNARSKRYALLVEGGKVQKVFVEPDSTGLAETTVEKVLG